MHRTAGTTSGTDATDERLAYSVPDAAGLIGLSPRRTWDLVRLRRIKSFMEGGRRLISRRALEAYVAEREEEAA
jgi:excisionase family DNA binding protein